MADDKIRSHWHITIKGSEEDLKRAAVLLPGSKPTFIDLHQKSGLVADRMLTGYQMGTHRQSSRDAAERLIAAGFNVVRVKLEAELFDWMRQNGIPSFLFGEYAEFHFHVDSRVKAEGLVEYTKPHFSSNPAANGKLFANFRAYREDELMQCINAFAGLENVHHELAVYDTNILHDADWWEGN